MTYTINDGGGALASIVGEEDGELHLIATCLPIYAERLLAGLRGDIRTTEFAALSSADTSSELTLSTA